MQTRRLTDTALGLLVTAVTAVALGAAETPAGRRLARYLTAFNSGDRATIERFTEEAYDPALLRHRPAARIVDQDARSAAASRGYDLVRVTAESARQVAALVRSRASGNFIRVAFVVGEEAPFRIERRTLLPATPPPDPWRVPSTDRELAAALDAYATQLGDAGRSSAVILLARGDDILLQRGAGYRDRSAKEPMTPATHVTLASMGKMFTAVAVGQLVEAGKLRFDDTVGAQLGDALPPAMRGITVAQLLTHSSGLPQFFDTPEQFTARLRIRRMSEFLPLVAKTELEFQPGERSAYSNAGFLVLGAIVERVSGVAYADYVRRNIFERAGMHETFNLAPAGLKNVANPYTKLLPGGGMSPDLHPACEKEPCDLDPGSSAGGGYSTVGDLLAFARALREDRLLKRATRDRLWTPRVPSPWGGDYGYGFAIDRNHGTTVIGHGGDFTGTNTQFDLYLETGYTLVVLANMERPAASGIADVVRDWLASRP